MKESYNILYMTYESDVIPRKIFQTWNTKDLPPKMKETTEEKIQKTENP